MQLAFSSNAYLRFPIEETIARIAALGYRGIELLADVPHAWPAGLLDQQKQSIRDTLAKHQLKISNINAFMMNAILTRPASRPSPAVPCFPAKLGSRRPTSFTTS